MWESSAKAKSEAVVRPTRTSWPELSRIRAPVCDPERTSRKTGMACVGSAVLGLEAKCRSLTPFGMTTSALSNCYVLSVLAAWASTEARLLLFSMLAERCTGLGGYLKHAALSGDADHHRHFSHDDGIRRTHC